MKLIATLALLLIGTVHAGEPRQVPVMLPTQATAQAYSPPPVQLPTPWPEVRANAIDGERGQKATDAPTIVTLAVGQCPGGVCPVPQRSTAVSYTTPTMQASTVYAASPPASCTCTNCQCAGQASQAYATSPVVYQASSSPRRAGIFARMFSADRPRLFGGFFAKGVGRCCGK